MSSDQPLLHAEDLNSYGGPFRDFDSQGNVVFDSRTAAETLPKPPVVLWSEPQAPHAIENLADEPSHLIRFELKK